MPSRLLRICRLAIHGLLLAAACIASATAAFAQLPTARLFSVFPAGGQRGTTVDIVIARGADLDDHDQMLFSHHGITATPKLREVDGKPTEERIENTYAVTIAPDVPPGIYELHVGGRFGLSNPRAFAVSDRPETVESEENNTPETAQQIALDTIVNARCEGETDVDYYAIDVKAGQRILVECWAERIDSRMDATLELFGPDGKFLDSSRDAVGLEPLLDFTAPADGPYRLRVFDFIYSNGPDYFYRLAASTAPHVDFAFPPAGEPGTTQTFTLYGRNLPGGEATELVDRRGNKLEKVTIQIDVPSEPDAAASAQLPEAMRPGQAGLQAFQYRLESEQGASNPVTIGLASAPVLAETEPNDAPEQAQKVQFPCELVGQFGQRGDRDWIELEATKGQHIHVDVISSQMGLPTDPWLAIQQVHRGDDGKEVVREIKSQGEGRGNVGGREFDTANDDPRADFEVPEDGLYRIMVRDLYASSQGSPRLVYRIVIGPPRPDFELVAVARRDQIPNPQERVEQASPLLRRGGTTSLDLLALRRDGYGEPIQVTVENLPEGVRATPCVIGSGETRATLVLSAAEDAGAWRGPIRMVGRGKIGDAEVVREASSGSVTWEAANGNERSRARLTTGIMLAVVEIEQAPVLVELGADGVSAPQGGKVSVPLKVTRRQGFAAEITLQPVGLPQQIKAAEIKVAPDAQEASLELTIEEGAPLGPRSFHLQSPVKFAYRRNVATVEAAEAAKAEAIQLAEQAAGQAEQAKTQHEAASTTVAEAEAARAATVEALATAESALAEVTSAARLAALAELAKAARENPTPESLAALRTAAEQAAQLAERQRKAAEELAQATATAEGAVKAAAEAIAARDAAAQQAQKLAEQSQAAQQQKQEAEKKAAEVNEANKPQDIDLVTVSTTAVISVTPKEEVKKAE
ncbi:MAG: PPC domain-containing protein [Pirellulales bacterium]